MGKRRLIDMDGLCFDPELAELGLTGCMLYIRLWSLAEDWGGVTIDPKRLHLQMGGLQTEYTVSLIQEIIIRLINLKKIIVYRAAGCKYGWLKNFPKHQKFTLPSPPKMPLPSWVKWHPKETPDSPKQHYEFLDLPSDISSDSTDDGTADISSDSKRAKQSSDISTDQSNLTKPNLINTNISSLSTELKNSTSEMSETSEDQDFDFSLGEEQNEKQEQNSHDSEPSTAPLEETCYRCKGELDKYAKTDGTLSYCLLCLGWLTNERLQQLKPFKPRLLPFP